MREKGISAHNLELAFKLNFKSNYLPNVNPICFIVMVKGIECAKIDGVVLFIVCFSHVSLYTQSTYIYIYMNDIQYIFGIFVFFIQMMCTILINLVAFPAWLDPLQC